MNTSTAMLRATSPRSSSSVKLSASSSSATPPTASLANGPSSHLPSSWCVTDCQIHNDCSLTVASSSSLLSLLAHTVRTVVSTVCFLHLLLTVSFLVSVSVVNTLPVLSVAPKALVSWKPVLVTGGSSGSPTWQSIWVSSWLHLFP